jgi:general secretion pathway protein G
MKKRNALNNEQGFSLLEIMIVLGIIGTIIAMIGQRVLGARDRAKVKEAQMQLSQITEAISMYYNDCGKNPATLENIIKPDPECNNWDPGNYAKLKTTDPWNHPVIYSIEGTDFVLKSLGKDGKEGGSGFDADIDAGSTTGEK